MVFPYQKSVVDTEDAYQFGESSLEEWPRIHVASNESSFGSPRPQSSSGYSDKEVEEALQELPSDFKASDLISAMNRRRQHTIDTLRRRQQELLQSLTSPDVGRMLGDEKDKQMTLRQNLEATEIHEKLGHIQKIQIQQMEGMKQTQTTATAADEKDIVKPSQKGTTCSQRSTVVTA